MDILSRVGNNIKYYRKKLGYTQEDLGNLLGYERSAITKIESGKIDLPQSKLVQFAKVLGCSPGELLDIEVDLPDKLSELLTIARHLSDSSLDKLLERAKELAMLERAMSERAEGEAMWDYTVKTFNLDK